MHKVLVIGTSNKTRGGITSVINAHKNGEQWTNFHCKWIETHIDKGAIWKLFYLIKGWLQFIILLPYYDLIHIHTSESPSAIRKCLFMPFAKLLGKKVIVHFHAFSPETTIDSKYQKIYKYLFNEADCVIVLSQLWEKYVNDVFHLGNKVKVIYNPCTTEILEKKYAKKKQILFAGTVNARKGYAEGFPMAVLDAWAYGLPVITTPVGGIPDIAEDGKNILLFNAGDTEKLAYNMKTLIDNEDLRNQIINESIKLAKTIFNIDTINKQIESLYQELLT